MKINKEFLVKILMKLEEKYPLPIGSDGYAELVDEFGSDLIVDGHLLYADEKGYITAEMELDSSAEGWSVNPYGVRITAYGLDILSGDVEK